MFIIEILKSIIYGIVERITGVATHFSTVLDSDSDLLEV